MNLDCPPATQVVTADVHCNFDKIELQFRFQTGPQFNLCLSKELALKLKQELEAKLQQMERMG